MAEEKVNEEMVRNGANVTFHFVGVQLFIKYVENRVNKIVRYENRQGVWYGAWAEALDLKPLILAR